jgi:ribosomal-protein-alanine N-acetyltransferase
VNKNLSQQRFPFLIEPMQLADINEVIAVEQASYTLTWPKRAYDYELQKNELANYFVLRILPPQADHPPAKSSSPIIGLGGFWLIADAAHITTLAISPTWRRLGLGEWLLITLLEEGQKLGASITTLEVRPSNHAAQSLYQKYRFQAVGRRPRYYSDNGEDALILTTPKLILPDYQAMIRQRKATLVKRLARIRVDKIRQIS